MKVLFVINVDFALRHFLLPLMRAARSRGHEVVAACAPGDMLAPVRAEGFRVVEIPFSRGLSPRAHGRALRMLMALMRAEKPDLVHAHMPISGWLARLAARLTRVPRIAYTCHGFLFNQPGSVIRRAIAFTLDFMAGRWATDIFLTVSLAEAADAGRLRIARTPIAVGNGRDPAIFRPDPAARAAMRVAMGVTEDRVVIISVARLVYHKGFFELAVAMALAPDAELWVVGDRLASDRGPDVATALRGVGLGDRLRLLGMRDDVPALLAAADIFVLASHFEGLPMAVIEAMLSALPVVACNIRGPAEQVIDGETGLLVPPVDADALARALRRLVADKNLRAAMGAAGRMRAMQCYDAAVVTARTLDALGLWGYAAPHDRKDFMMTDFSPIRRALISVSDKTGLVEFGRALVVAGVEILSTGGSAKALRDAGVAVKEVSDHTGFPEILGGRVKTLVPQIHGGILGRRDLAEHVAQMAAHDIAPIDLVAVNLYPFEATVARGAAYDDCVENIDIGGPALIRAAAKNHDFVTVLTGPSHYPFVLAEISSRGGTSAVLRRTLAGEAYARTAAYDAAIGAWFAQQQNVNFPPRLTIAGTLRQELRYGENPHQAAAFYATEARPGVATATQIQGKELSYNNLNDTDAAFECVAEFDAPTVVIVKHANPCGIASATTLADAWDAALRCDPVSAFGGIVAVNRMLDGAAAEKIAGIFTEVIVAPDADDAAKAILSRKKNLRVLLTGGLPDAASPGLNFRSLAGGFLAQTRDAGRITAAELKTVTQRAPTAEELQDLLFAFRVCKHVKSNAIVYVKARATVGIGAGQMSRVDSARIAAWKSEEAAKAAGLATPLAYGSVVASDAFFPFADGLQAAIAAGATAVIQPGGSIRDAEVIAAADAANIAMVFTGMRHFRH